MKQTKETKDCKLTKPKKPKIANHKTLKIEVWSFGQNKMPETKEPHIAYVTKQHKLTTSRYMS